MQNKSLLRAVAALVGVSMIFAGCSYGPNTGSDLVGETEKQTASVSSTSSVSVTEPESSSEDVASESVASSSSSSDGSEALVAEPVTASSSEENVVYETNTEARVRTTPSTDGDIYTSLEEGTEIEVEGEENGWYKVRLDGGIYYIREDLVDKTVGRSSAGDGRTIVIDPGHQAEADQSQEPVGPGASEMKAKVSVGATGKTTGLAEYELNLEIGLKLQDILTERGYNVIMTRTSNDVNISNAERAEIANDANADAFIRVHANGSENSGVSGAMTICQTKSNPYNGDLYEESRALAEDVLAGIVASAGCRQQSVWETDTMSGINWCQVPATIVEVGYLSNAEEEQKLATDEYQQKIADGIADGVDEYLAN